MLPEQPMTTKKKDESEILIFHTGAASCLSEGSRLFRLVGGPRANDRVKKNATFFSNRRVKLAFLILSPDQEGKTQLNPSYSLLRDPRMDAFMLTEASFKDVQLSNCSQCTVVSTATVYDISPQAEDSGRYDLYNEQADGPNTFKVCLCVHVYVSPE